MNQELIKRSGYAFFGVVIFYIMLISKGGETFTSPDTYWDLRALLSFHLKVVLMLIACAITRGPNNFRLVMSLSVTLLLINKLHTFLWFESEISNLYVKIWFDTIIYAPIYIVMKYNDLIYLKVLSVLSKTNALEEWCFKRMIEVSTTKFELYIVPVFGLIVAVEFSKALYEICYGLSFGIGIDGSTFQTIQSNGHWDHYNLYIMCLDAVSLIWFFLMMKLIVEEWADEPDLLIKGA